MKKLGLVLALLLGVHIFLLENLQFTAWPEMLSYPYLRNSGFLLYKDMIHPYPPVLTMFLSILYKFFGYKLIVLKLVTWLMILVNDVLVFLIVKKITNKYGFALLSLTLYALTQPFLEGNMLWFDLAIVPTVLFGILLLLHRKYFLAGLGFGVALLTKQTSALLLLAGMIWVFTSEKKIKPVMNLIIGPILLSLILVARLITEGALAGFINWTLIYPLTFWSKFPGYVQMALSKNDLIIIAVLCIPAAIMLIKRKNLYVLPFFLSSLILIYPRFSFFHFQLGIALWAVISVVLLSKSKKYIYVIYASCLILIFMVIKPKMLVEWGKETRFWSADDIGRAEIIKKETSSVDRIYLSGPHSGLYVFADRLPAKPWSDNFGWYLEIPGIQENIIESWNSRGPEHVFTTQALDGNWFDLGTYRPKKILKWIEDEGINTIAL